MSNSRITTFKDLNKADDVKRNYTGGQSSGLQTMDPQEFFKKMMQMKQKFEENDEDNENDEESEDENDKESEDEEDTEQEIKRFHGKAHKLGKEVQNPKIVITYWSDGFTIDVECCPTDFRNYTNPENIKFLQDFENSILPREILMKLSSKTENIDIRVLEKKDLFYHKILINPNTIKMKIRFFDGEEMIKEFNQDATVKDLDTFMKIYKKVPIGKQYEMIINYPRQILNDLSVPLSKIQNDVIIQKIKI